MKINVKNLQAFLMAQQSGTMVALVENAVTNFLNSNIQIPQLQFLIDLEILETGEPMSGIDLIAAERAEQISKHGFTPEMDMQNAKEEMVLLANYLLMDDSDAEKDNLREYFESCNYNMTFINKFDSKNKIERLTIAGALLAAEIDRIK